MPASSSLFKMSFSNSNQAYGNGNNSNNNRKNVGNSSTKLRMDLSNSMIGRIKNAPAGCGACGK